MAQVRRKTSDSKRATTHVKMSKKVLGKKVLEVLGIDENEGRGISARVQVSMGITTSHNYQSTKFDVGLSQDVRPGESVDDGQKRTLSDVEKFWAKQITPVLDHLMEDVTNRAERRKNLSS